MSRLFVPVRDALNVVCVVDCAGEGAGLDEMSPSGRRSVPTSEAGPGSQGRPDRVERSELRSGVLDGQEQRSYQGDHARARLRDACKNRWTERRAPDQLPTVGRVGCAPATSRESPAGWATGPGFSPTIMPGEPHFRRHESVLPSFRNAGEQQSHEADATPCRRPVRVSEQSQSRRSRLVRSGCGPRRQAPCGRA
jgi:hypothetical protein